MSENANVAGYGYVNDEDAIRSGSNIVFGLNTPCKLIKFGWIDNAGKGGAAGEALDIVFDVNGTEKGYRMFPVTKAYKGKEEVTDPKSPEMQEAYKQFSAIITHILGCYVPKDQITVAFAKKIASFQEYCKIAKGLLKKDAVENTVLDIFFQFQWQMTGENNRTFLEIPRKMSNGRFLSKAVAPLNEDGTPGEWKAVVKENPTDSEKEALTYVDGAGNKHPFVRNGWFMNSNYAKVQKENGEDDDSIIVQTPTAGISQTDAPATGNAPASSDW